MVEAITAVSGLALGAAIGFLIATVRANGALNAAQYSAALAKERVDVLEARVAEVTTASGQREAELRTEFESPFESGRFEPAEPGRSG